MAQGDGSGERGRQEQQSFLGSYVRGLHSSVLNNASAYGYSVMITSSLATLSAANGAPASSEVFLFAGGAILAFAVVEVVASRGFQHGYEEEPSRVKALGSSISFFSVGGALALAFFCGRVVSSSMVWALVSFLATIAYLLLFALEMSVANRIERHRKGG